MESSFTVFFDGTFWVGVVEVGGPDGSVRAARHVFGGEPTAAELWTFVQREAGRLLDVALAAPAVPAAEVGELRRMTNPKRLARSAARQQRVVGPSTAAQAALSAAREASAEQRRLTAGEDRRAAEARRRDAEVAKRKARHRGR